jgi:2,6-dihydroxypseudooxynicotine hydrolase
VSCAPPSDGTVGVTDARVEAAIRHWAGRFIANGVDYNDFSRTTASISRWEDWLPGWTATAGVHVELAERATAAGRRRSAGEAWLRAAISYHFSKFVWILDPERHRENTTAAVRALGRAHYLLGTGARRIEAPLGAAHVVANLRRPAGVEAPALVILIPGLDSTKEEFFHWEQVFLDRGMATLSLDGPGQGETGFALPIRPDYEVAVAAILNAVVDAENLDARRIGAVGVSLGGHYVVRAAAFEPRIRALASISGPFDFAAGWDAMPDLTRETVAFATGSSDDAGARLCAGKLDLTAVAERVTVPSLVITGALDRVIAWTETRRIAEAIPGAEWVLYDQGTHVCNNIPYIYRPLVADWMADQLSPVTNQEGESR